MSPSHIFTYQKHRILFPDSAGLFYSSFTKWKKQNKTTPLQAHSGLLSCDKLQTERSLKNHLELIIPKAALLMKICNWSEEARSHLWNAGCHRAGINAAFNGHSDSAAALFLTVEFHVNGVACHCCETINRSVIMVEGNVDLLFFLFFVPPWYLICSAQRGEELVLINRSHGSVFNWRIIMSLPERCPQLKPLTALFHTRHKRP